MVSGYRVDINFSENSYFAFYSDGFKNSIFTSGKDLTITGPSSDGRYTNYGYFTNTAQSGSTNYANISFNGNDTVYEAVGQFSFDGSGGGYLVALAINGDNSALSISAGKAAIDAVPEPSAIALLALGAGGMAMRRRKVA